MKLKIDNLLVAGMFGLLFVPSVAFGYVDPGSGHLLLQLIYAAGFGAIFFLKNLVAPITALFRQKKVPVPTEKPKSVTRG